MRGLSASLAVLLLVAGIASGEGAGVNIGGSRSTDFGLDIGAGRVPGTTFIEKFGENPDIDTATFETIWDGDGIYVPPTVARLHNVVSSLAADAGTVLSSGTATGGSATTLEHTGATFSTDTVAAGDLLLNDDNVLLGVITAVEEELLTFAGGMRNPNSGLAGAANASGDAYRVVTDASTGASVFHILGLDASRLDQEEFVVMNGVSNVATANTYIRQHRARIFTTAATDAAGTITSTAATDGTVSLQVISSNNQTLMTIYTCPSNKICYIEKWFADMSRSVASAVSLVNLMAGSLDGVGYVLQPRALHTTGSSRMVYNYPVPVPIPGGADIWVEANSTANDVGVSAGFTIIIEDN